MVRGLTRDTAINQVDSPQYENELRFVWLSRGLRLPSEASFCGAFPLRRMFLHKVATFALHDPVSDCFVTDFCEARCSLRSGNATKRSGGQVAEGDREAIRKYPRESINHLGLSTLFIVEAIDSGFPRESPPESPSRTASMALKSATHVFSHPSTILRATIR